MNNVNIADVICHLTDKMKGKPFALYFKITFCADQFAAEDDEDGEDITRYRTLHIITASPKGGNYISVYAADDVDDERWLGFGSIKKWKFLSRHDSAWRSDGVSQAVSQLTHDLREKISAISSNNEEITVQVNNMKLANPVSITTTGDQKNLLEVISIISV